MSSEDFAARLQRAVVRHIGAPGTLHELRRLTGGAMRSTWSFEAEVEGARRPFILQVAIADAAERPDPIAEMAPRLTAEQDARLMLAATGAGVPAPRVCAVLDRGDGLGPGHITERVAGESLGSLIVREERFAAARAVMAEQCGTILAAIHRIDPAAVPFLKHQDPATQVTAQRAIVDHYGHRLPALELGLRWAAEHLPRNPRHTVAHGDFRTGNLIVGEEGVRCVIDWELARIGDPMQDLGWICVKTWRFGGARPVGGFGSREQLFAAYEKASGHVVDAAHVRFWEAFGNLRWAIGCLRMGMRYSDGMEPINVEHAAIGRRLEEPLWDFLNLIEGRE